jgi:biopolymer transport protein ExbB
LRRSSAEVHLEMKRGLRGLATIASTAPFVGLFGTVLGILNAFKGCSGPLWYCLVAVIGGICEALVSTALGLLVAISAGWFYNYLSDKMEAFDIEMKVASLELVNYFVLCLGRREKSQLS